MSKSKQQQTRTLNYKYSPTETVRKMHEFLEKYWIKQNLPLVIGCLGPPESGKSVGVIQMLNMVKWSMPEVINEQTGRREKHSKIGICRDTVKQIRDGPYNTMKQGWFPVDEVFGKINNATSGSNAPIEGTLEIPTVGGETCVVQLQGIIFGDNIEDAKERLKSVEFTCVYINEIQSLPPDVINLMMERVGRYPGGSLGTAKAKLVIIDYNMPPEGSWCEHLHMKNAVYTAENPMGYRIMPDLGLRRYNLETLAHDIDEGLTLDDVVETQEVTYIQYIFMQPPAAFEVPVGKSRNGEVIYQYVANPDAEVPPHGRGSPYPALIAQAINRGQERDVKRELCLLPVPPLNDKPVYGEQMYKADAILDPYYPAGGYNFTLAGSDTSGNNPAIVFYQLTPHGWILVRELCVTSGTFKDLMDRMDEFCGETPQSGKEISKDRMIIICDPANAKDAWTGLDPISHLRNRGYYAVPASTNRRQYRIDNARMRILAGHVEPEPDTEAPTEGQVLLTTGAIKARALPDRVWYSKSCRMTVEALTKGHVYKKVAGEGEGTFHFIPNKHTAYSHYADSNEYAMLGLTDILHEDSIERTIDDITQFRNWNNGGGADLPLG